MHAKTSIFLVEKDRKVNWKIVILIIFFFVFLLLIFSIYNMCLYITFIIHICVCVLRVSSPARYSFVRSFVHIYILYNVGGAAIFGTYIYRKDETTDTHARVKIPARIVLMATERGVVIASQRH